MGRIGCSRTRLFCPSECRSAYPGLGGKQEVRHMGHYVEADRLTSLEGSAAEDCDPPPAPELRRCSALRSTHGRGPVLTRRVKVGP